MAFGERIRKFRNMIGMTQQELGTKLGFSEKSAVIRVGQYENENRKPKQDMINNMAYIFDVASESITVPDIDNYIGLMHTLFALEDRYGLTVTMLDGQICLKQDINHPNYNRSLADDLQSWYDKKSKLTSGSILASEYDHWRYNFPADRVAETRQSLDELSKKMKNREDI
mgnify:FL=1